MVRIHTVSIYPLNVAQKRRLERWGTLVYHEARIGDDTIPEKCRGAEVLVITPRLHLPVVPCLDGCRLISVQGTGTDAINVPAATAKGIAVCNVPEFASDAVAEHAFALLLSITRRLALGREILCNGTWRDGLAYEVAGLHGKTLGIFGFGRIGRRIGRIGLGFGMNVVATTKDPDGEQERKHQVTLVDFDQLLARSDYLVLAAPVTPETLGIFGKQQFERMKPSAILINVSRGALVDEAALIEALRDHKIAGVGVDVFPVEPPSMDHPLLHLENVTATPHVAWGTGEAVQALLDGAIANVEAFLEGRPQNVVNPEVLARA